MIITSTYLLVWQAHEGMCSPDYIHVVEDQPNPSMCIVYICQVIELTNQFTYLYTQVTISLLQAHIYKFKVDVDAINTMHIHVIMLFCSLRSLSVHSPL